MVIDFHTHLRGGWGTTSDLVQTMDQNGVDVAVVAALEPPDPELGPASAEWVAEQTRAFPDRLLPFACLNPCEPGAPARLRGYVRDLGCRGLKLHPPLQQFSMTNPSIVPTLRMAGELGIPVLIHTGPIFVTSARYRFTFAADVDDVARVCPETNLVLAHGDPLGDAAVLAGKHRNVYFDTSIVFPRMARLLPGIGEEVLEWMSAHGLQHGEDKILFGSDANPRKADRMTNTIAVVRSLSIGNEAKAKILGGNAARLLGL